MVQRLSYSLSNLGPMQTPRFQVVKFLANYWGIYKSFHCLHVLLQKKKKIIINHVSSHFVTRLSSSYSILDMNYFPFASLKICCNLES